MKTILLALSCLTLICSCSSNQLREYSANVPDLSIAVSADVANTLQDFEKLSLLSVSNPQQALLNGDALVAISRDKWNDENIAELTQRYGEKLLMTIFSAENSAGNNFKKISSGEMTIIHPWYLYTNFSDNNNNENLLSLLQYLYSEQSQQQLAHRGLLALPQPLINRAQVQLGLTAASFDGGYK
jgi:hypothetical protein